MCQCVRTCVCVCVCVCVIFTKWKRKNWTAKQQQTVFEEPKKLYFYTACAKLSDFVSGFTSSLGWQNLAKLLNVYLRSKVIGSVKANDIFVLHRGRERTLLDKLILETWLTPLEWRRSRNVSSRPDSVVYFTTASPSLPCPTVKQMNQGGDTRGWYWLWGQLS